MATSMTGFADVPFRVLRSGSGSVIVSDFVRDSFTGTRHIPGSDTNDTFLMGRGPATVTWRIESPTLEDHQDLDALVQTTGTLRIPHGVTTAPHTESVFYGDVYDEIATVTLLTLGNLEIRNDGTVHADATFLGSW